MHGYRLDAELFARANDPHGDLAAIGDQDFFEHQPFLSLKSFCPNSTLLPFSTSTSRIVPEASLSISFISFIASMMHRAWPSFTLVPTSTKFFASGEGAR